MTAFITTVIAFILAYAPFIAGFENQRRYKLPSTAPSPERAIISARTNATTLFITSPLALFFLMLLY